MSQIETEHKDYKIRYSENEDVWRCWELDLEAKTLSALKAKINQIDAAGRKLDRVSVYVFGGYGLPKEAIALSWAGKGKLWILEGKRRSQEPCDRISRVTPEITAAIKQAGQLQSQAQEIRKQADSILAAIPRWEPAATAIADDADISSGSAP